MDTCNHSFVVTNFLPTTAPTIANALAFAMVVA
jgi:hypothetical protein